MTKCDNPAFYSYAPGGGPYLCLECNELMGKAGWATFLVEIPDGKRCTTSLVKKAQWEARAKEGEPAARLVRARFAKEAQQRKQRIARHRKEIARLKVRS